ncbi:hypothetical protein MP638_001186 [Amoeboaphelidium occidentale]|nr:hypothetical protein MP638_001186 [Amoeboaphelidium occidentale]
MSQELQFDPWKTGSEQLKSPVKEEPPPLPDVSALLSNIKSVQIDDDKLAKIAETKQVLFDELCHVAATSNVQRLKEIMTTFELECVAHVVSTADREAEWKLFLDNTDASGSSPLHYAACFGQKENCFILLSHGASVDVQDKHGWTPLIWATNNAHDDCVKLLVERGARSDSQLSGTFGSDNHKITVGDFLSKATHDFPNNSAMVSTLDSAGLRSTSRMSYERSKSPTSAQGFYKAGYDFHSAIEEELKSNLFGTDKATISLFSSGLSKTLTSSHSTNKNFDDNYDDDDDGDDISDNLQRDFGSPTAAVSPGKSFHWDKCLPDEMFVFDFRQIPTLLDLLVTNLKLPHMTKASLTAKLATSTSIFLATRYAHYYGGADLMDGLLKEFCLRLRQVLAAKSSEMVHLAYWLSNSSQLLYYFKRDPGLLTSTGPYQVQLCEVINDIYSWLIDDGERRLERLIISGLCDYEPIPGGDSIEYDKKRKNTTGLSKNSSKSSMESSKEDHNAEKQENFFSSVMSKFKKSGSNGSKLNSPANMSAFFSFQNQTKPKPPPENSSPKSITTILSSTLFVLQSYQNHPSFQSQYIRQMFYIIGCQVFNALLNHRSYCTRWKAMQIRMNLSVLEDWIRMYSHLKGVKETIKRRRLRRPSSDSQKHSHVLEDLIYPIPVKSLDYYLRWLQPTIVACQILQIASTSFAEGTLTSKGENALDAFIDTIDSMVKEPPQLVSSPAKTGMTRSVSIMEWNSLNTQTLSYAQLHRLLVINYIYEKSEPSLSTSVVEYLENNRLRKIGPGEATPELTPNPSMTQLNKSGELPNIEKRPSKASSVGPVTLYKDTKYRLAFRLYLVPADAIKEEDNLAPGEWHDPTEEHDRLARIKEKEKERQDEESWWEKIKIEVPHWVVEAVE